MGVEVGGTRCGYWRRAAPAADLAALEDEEPIYFESGWRVLLELKVEVSGCELIKF